MNTIPAGQSHTFGYLFHRALSAARAANYRQLLWLSGEPQWCYQQLKGTENQLKTLNSLAVISQAQQQAVGLISPLAKLQIQPKDCHKYLGTEQEVIVFDGYSALNPDHLAQISGTLIGGGVFVLITPDVDQWGDWQESELNNLWVQPYQLADVSRHFLYWLQENLLTDPSVIHLSQGVSDRLPLTFTAEPEVLAELENLASRVSPVALAQQLSVVGSIASYLLETPRSSAVLTAPRGRGKSSALGLLASDLASSKTLYLTAANKSAVQQVERYSGGGITFSSVIQLLSLESVAQNGVLIIDEAASLSVTVLQQLHKKFPQVVFSTTTQGYEGTGQGFKLRFISYLSSHKYLFKRYQLELPMRWAQGDPLEDWLSNLLFLNHSSQMLAIDDTSLVIKSDGLTIQQVSGCYLIDHPALLQQLFSLLSQAHYRTTPNDLRVLLDSPNMSVWLACLATDCGVEIVGACLVALEGPIEAFSLDEQQMNGSELALAMFRGLRRPRGNLIPQILIAQEGYLTAQALKVARVVRIATRSDARRGAVASQLLTQVSIWAKTQSCHFVGANFSLQAGLLKFWQHQGFSLVRIGSQLDANTASYSATVLYQLENQCELSSRVLASMLASLPERLAFQWQRVFEPLVSRQMMADIIGNEKEQNLSVPSQCKAQDWQLGVIDDWDQQQLLCFADYHRPFMSVGYIIKKYLSVFFTTAAIAHKSALGELVLSERHQSLAQDYFFSDMAIERIYEKYCLLNYRALQKEMRSLVKCLLSMSKETI